MSFITRLVDQLKDLADVVGLLTAGNDGKALTWNNGTSAFGMSALGLSPNGSTVGAISQPQAFTEGLQGTLNIKAIGPSQGTLGDEMVANTDFAENANGWTGAGWTWSAYQMAHVSGSDPLIYAAAIPANGEYYFATVQTGSSSQAGITVHMGDSSYYCPGNGIWSIVLRCGGTLDPLTIYPYDMSDPETLFDGILRKGSIKLMLPATALLTTTYEDDSEGNLTFFAGAGGTGGDNLQIGHNAGLYMGENAIDNLAFGPNSLELGVEAGGNIAIGANALRTGGEVTNNIAIGPHALLNAQEASANVAVGGDTLLDSTRGEFNVAVGYQAAYTMTGNNNTVVGARAGKLISSGDGNVFVGYHAGDDLALNFTQTPASNQLRIADGSLAVPPLIAGDFSAQTLQINGTLLDGNGDPIVPQAAYCNPATATVADVVNALISAGLMASS